MNGFKIVDPDCPASYYCPNYNSITREEFVGEMSTLLRSELESHKVTRASAYFSPHCVHSLGAVTKSDARLRPITDCSRPEGVSINNFMTTSFESFSYNSVETAVHMLSRANFLAVVDISSAYRSVSVHKDHTIF